MTQKILAAVVFLGGSLLIFSLLTNKGSIRMSDGASAFYTVAVAHAYDDADGSGPGQGCGGCGVGTGSGPGSADGGGDGGAVGPGTDFGTCPSWCGGGGGDGGSGSPVGTYTNCVPVCDSEGGGCYYNCPDTSTGISSAPTVTCDSSGNTVYTVTYDESAHTSDQVYAGIVVVANPHYFSLGDPLERYVPASGTQTFVFPYGYTPSRPGFTPQSRNAYQLKISPNQSAFQNGGQTYDSVQLPDPPECTPSTPPPPSTTPPTKPTDLHGSCTDTSVQLYWTGSSADTSYDLRVNDKSDGWSDVGPCSAQSSNDICIDNYPSTSKTFTGQLGHTYEWWVHGVNAAGDVSDPAGGSLFTCTPTTPPSPPTNYTATCDATSGTPLTMRWDASAGATVYAASLILPHGSSCPDSSWTPTSLSDGSVGCQKATSGTSITAAVPLGVSTLSTVYAGNPMTGYNPVPSTPVTQSCTASPTAALTASPDTVTQGNSSTLSWSSTNATSCVFADSPSTPRATSGTRSVTPSTTSTYSVTCSNASKTSAPAQATVTVLSPTVSITANPTRTLSDGKTTVSWNATEVNTCTITKNGVAWKTNLTDPSHTISGSSPDTISGQTLYKMTCEDLSASTQAASVVVNAGSGGFQEF